MFRKWIHRAMRAKKDRRNRKKEREMVFIWNSLGVGGAKMKMGRHSAD